MAWSLPWKCDDTEKAKLSIDTSSEHRNPPPSMFTGGKWQNVKHGTSRLFSVAKGSLRKFIQDEVWENSLFQLINVSRETVWAEVTDTLNCL